MRRSVALRSLLVDACLDNLSRATPGWPTWLRYTLAVRLALCSAGVRALLDEHLATYSPYVVFFPAIFFSAFLLGRGGGGVCTMASAVLAVYLFVEPRGSLGPLAIVDALSLSIFIGVGLLATFIIEALHFKTLALRDALDRAIRAETAKAELLREINQRIKN
jgi:K+-sensing histidine kinase KdpD